MSHKASPDVAPFIQILSSIVENEPQALRWLDDGRAFQIHDMDLFTTVVLAKYFKHNKYSSFQRQLNYFGFKKWTKRRSTVCTFSHECFVRDFPDLRACILRQRQRDRTYDPLMEPCLDLTCIEHDMVIACLQECFS
ncbi:hypothetical protein DYB32_007482 [Aphanomyces invadans]|uniref:HSF-type DNA-binding domain-containing protein n=1 Tax=Aphanomyces invadans TaxID=157072 RepID=A0A3R6Z0E1_9STRA|nr:hypothetical protein DYB32_007482 [Aphanomyces invadans]